MRSILLLLILVGSVPFCLVNPYYGVLMWFWTSYFNPHRFTWGFTYNLPVALIVAVPTILGTLFCKKSLRSLLTREAVLLLGLWLWYAISYVNALGEPNFEGHMVEASYEINHISKIFLMMFIMIMVITTRQKLHGVLLVSAGSLGLLALKGTLFGLRTSGEFRVFGPPDSFLTDNNAFGLAVNVSLPILFFLAREETIRWRRSVLYTLFGAGVTSVLLTYSRGGLLGLAMVLGLIMLRSRHKTLSVIALATSAFLVLSFAPDSWMNRMSQFAAGNLDATANQRLVSWGTAWRFAHDYPVAGGSFDALPDVAIYQRYQPRPLPDGLVSSGPHSIYFQLLADQGFIGVALFLVLIASCFWTLFRVRRLARQIPSAGWMINHTFMIEASMIAFMTSGAFLGFAYLDLIYQMIGIVVILKMLLRKEIESYLRLPSEKSAVERLEEAQVLA